MTREEAIRIIESNCSCSGSPLREACAMFIPELRESEDERIRKGLIKVVSDIAGSWPFEEHKITKKEALAYLEKQKEYKPTSFNEPYNPDDYEVVMEGNATSLKRKEQKPIEDVVKDITKNRESATKFLKSAGIMDDNGELAEMYRSEQKSANYNYDNRIQYDSIKSGVEAFASTYSFNIESKLFSQLTKEQQQLWREEIEQAVVAGGENGIELARDNRYKENRMVEWSEKDEWKKKELIQYLEEKGDYRTVWMTWLKSLCPYPHWKPSEEQMEALETAERWYSDNMGCNLTLVSLVEQLKKL